MARPIAVGLTYFPFDVDLLEDEALDYLREKYGMLVNTVYIRLLCLLYKKYGYYIPYETEKDKEDCVWYIFKSVRGGKYPPTKETISAVIDACVARGLFSRELYPKIITSKRAQETFYSATVERKVVSIDHNIWLLSIEDMERLSKKHPYYLEVCSKSKSGEKPSFSSEKQDCSGEKPLNEIKLNKTTLESKKVSNKNKNLHSYDEIFEDFGVTPLVKAAVLNFIRHLRLNGVLVINDRLESLLLKLDFKYGKDETLKIKEINQSIANGFMRLPCEGD